VATEKGAILSQLWEINYPGGEARRISRDVDTYGSPLSVSADSNLLLATQGRGDSNIWVASADNLGQARQVTFGSIGAYYGWNGLAWTTDSRLLFSGAKEQTRCLYAADADGGNLKQLTCAGSAGSFEQRPSVTADGQFIVFQSNRSGESEIWRANIDGSNLQQLTSGGGNSSPQATPDGESVVYTSGRENKASIWRVPLKGGVSVRMTDQGCAYPQISHDGKLIAYAHVVEGESGWRLAVAPTKDATLRRLFDVPRSARFLDGLRWTPDGKAVCYKDWANGIWKQEIDGGSAQRLAGLPEDTILYYGWSRDGKQFAFARGSERRDVLLLRDHR